MPLLAKWKYTPKPHGRQSLDIYAWLATGLGL